MGRAKLEDVNGDGLADLVIERVPGNELWCWLNLGNYSLRGPGVLTYNLGTGRGYSVLEMVAAFERASNRRVPIRISPRRPGDIAACYADPSLAREELGWTAALGLDRMCEDAWRWQVGNPKGYGES
jgi:UDP-glucose 4-epimerase